MLLETLLPRILNMSITGSIVIAVLLLLRPVLKKAPRIFSYGLWAVVLLRLLCPVTMRAEFSLLGVLDLPVTEDASIEYIPNDIVSDPFPKVDFLVEDATDLVNANLPTGWDQVAEKPLEDITVIATLIWLLGLVTLVSYSLHSLGKLRSRLDGARNIRENIYLSDHLDTPLVMGLLRPNIYLPGSLSREEQDFVLLHEDHHIRRGDHVLKLLSFIALCIHWFNPLVWLAFRLSDKDMEMSCDEAVVRDMDQNTRCDYSQTLLRLAAGRKVIAGGPLCFCEGDPKGRIRNILKWKRPRRITWITGSAVTVLLCASLLTDPVFAIETVPSFRGRLHLELPEGYGYTLLDDPQYSDSRRNIIIYREDAEHPITDGCISLDLSPGSPLVTPTTSKRSIKFKNAVKAEVFEDIKNSFHTLTYHTEGYGTFMVSGVHTDRWDAAQLSDFTYIIENITITGPVEYTLVDLVPGEHLAVSAGELENYGFWTDESYFCVDLAGASGKVSMELRDAYTGGLIESFVTEDAAKNDYHVFTGLTNRREYCLTVSCGDSVTVTIFQ